MIIVAPDSFKGSIGAEQVAAVVADEFRRAHPDSAVSELPLADGGEGTVAVACRAGMDRVSVTVSGPLGRPVTTAYARRGDEAVIELAGPAGLGLVPQPTPATALAASTVGVGELIVHAVAAGVRRVILGLGGSATTDGGAGLAQSLGAVITRSDQHSVDADGGGGLGQVAAVDLTSLIERLAGVEIVLATDVDNPLVGPDGAAAVFGPQKGADDEAVQVLDAILGQWADRLADAAGFDARDVPGAGAAGGAAMPLLAAKVARVEPGIEVMMGLVGFERRIPDARLLVVGEGALDQQSLRGKGPVGLARLARSHGVEVAAIVGVNRLGQDALVLAGIDRVYAMTDIESDQARCIADPEPVLRLAAARAAAETATRP